MNTKDIRTGTRFPPLPHPKAYASLDAWASQLVSTLTSFFQASGPAGEEMIQDRAISTEKLALNATYESAFTVDQTSLLIPQVPTSRKLISQEFTVSSSRSTVIIFFSHAHKLPRAKTYLLLDSATPSNYISSSWNIESFSSSQNVAFSFQWQFDNITPGQHSVALYGGVITPVVSSAHASLIRTLLTLQLKNPV